MTDFSFTDGVLRIATDDGRDIEIVWADQGFEPDDVADRGFGWHSLNGDDWAAIQEFPDNVSDIVGTSDGFIGRGGEAMWYSVDGLSWRRIGPYAAGAMLPWLGEVLVVPDQVQGREVQVWTADGSRPLPIATGIDSGWRASGAGPLGIVALGTDHSILYSHDGIDRTISPIPDRMRADADGRITPTIAVGDRSVVALLWKWGVNDSQSPSLWVGTPER
jgi:hypothetical protein